MPEAGAFRDLLEESMSRLLRAFEEDFEEESMSRLLRAFEEESIPRLLRAFEEESIPRLLRAFEEESISRLLRALRTARLEDDKDRFSLPLKELDRFGSSFLEFSGAVVDLRRAPDENVLLTFLVTEELLFRLACELSMSDKASSSSSSFDLSAFRPRARDPPEKVLWIPLRTTDPLLLPVADLLEQDVSIDCSTMKSSRPF